MQPPFDTDMLLGRAVAFLALCLLLPWLGVLRFCTGLPWLTVAAGAIRRRLILARSQPGPRCWRSSRRMWRGQPAACRSACIADSAHVPASASVSRWPRRVRVCGGVCHRGCLGEAVTMFPVGKLWRRGRRVELAASVFEEVRARACARWFERPQRCLGERAAPEALEGGAASGSVQPQRLIVDCNRERAAPGVVLLLLSGARV